jgi:Cu+-exporting ATPase
MTSHHPASATVVSGGDKHNHGQEHGLGDHAAGAARDPVCGMTVDPAAGKPTAEHGGHLYHFCSERCLSKFAAGPEQYLTATDPVCGMSVDRATAKHFSRHEGQGFYFCSAGCKAKFEAQPAKYLGDRPEPQAAPARSAAWRWSRWACRPAKKARTRNWSISPGASG